MEGDEIIKPEMKKLLQRFWNKILSPAPTGDVNLSGQTKSNSKPQIQKSVLLVYRNDE